ncbi:MAG: alpha/beta fold hydrolase [Oscillospiraceae bacterium]|nr:alpha/beta fold hydrolase [Oscillospiraceae bacterium]
MAFAAIASTIIVLILLISWYTYKTAFFSPKSKRYTPDDPLEGKQYEAVADNIHRIAHIMERYSFEPVTIESYDGLKLYGRYYHMKDGAPVEILMHGYRSHAYRDCSGGHALARKMGFNTLVIDQRAHGKSEGHTICFGVKERFDCLSWIRYANARFGDDTPIILSGLSMGAATVLMASGLDLPSNVACIMADSPYSAPCAIIEKVCADRRYPVALCRPFLHLGVLLYGGFRLNACTAMDAVSHAKVPILLIHGDADHFVPCSMTPEIARCCASRVEVQIFPDAGHGLCYMTDPIRYEHVVCDFLCSIPSLHDTIDKDYTPGKRP